LALSPAGFLVLPYGSDDNRDVLSPRARQILDDDSHSSGCGIGFERLIQFIMQAQSIKECVEFPRSPDYIMP